MINLIKDFILVNANLILLILAVELTFRLIPTKKPINLLALVARLLAKASILLAKVGKLLPENRRKNGK